MGILAESWRLKHAVRGTFVLTISDEIVLKTLVKDQEIRGILYKTL